MSAFTTLREVQQHPERHRAAAMIRQSSGMDVPCRIGLLLRRRLRRERVGVCQVFIDRAGDHIEIQPFGALRRVEHELRQDFGRRIAQPFLHRQAIALRLADLLRVVVKEQFVGEAFRRCAAENAADAARKTHEIDQVLARHLVIDVERIPAHRPVGLPLQFAAAAFHRSFERLAAIGIAPYHRAGGGVACGPSAPA